MEAEHFVVGRADAVDVTVLDHTAQSLSRVGAEQGGGHEKTETVQRRSGDLGHRAEVLVQQHGKQFNRDDDVHWLHEFELINGFHRFAEQRGCLGWGDELVAEGLQHEGAQVGGSFGLPEAFAHPLAVAFVGFLVHFDVELFEIGVADDAVEVCLVHERLDGDAVVALQTFHLFEGEALPAVSQADEHRRGGDEHLAGEGVAEAFDVGAGHEVKDEVRQLVEQREALALGRVGGVEDNQGNLLDIVVAFVGLPVGHDGSAVEFWVCLHFYDAHADGFE